MLSAEIGLYTGTALTSRVKIKFDRLPKNSGESLTCSLQNLNFPEEHIPVGQFENLQRPACGTKISNSNTYYKSQVSLAEKLKVGLVESQNQNGCQNERRLPCMISIHAAGHHDF